MLSIALIEDDPGFLKKLTEFVDRILKEKNVKYVLLSYANPKEFFFAYEKQFDLILTDIDMPEMNGYEAAKKIREMDKDVTLVFVTQLAQFAIKGYEVDAVDYILKPFNFDSFRLKMNRILQHIKVKDSGSLLVSLSSREKVHIKYSDLLCISSDDHFLEFVTTKKTYDAFGTLKKYEGLLDDSFFRCHSGFIINLAYVERLSKGVIRLTNGKEIPLARSKRKEFVQTMQRYFLRGKK